MAGTDASPARFLRNLALLPSAVVTLAYVAGSFLLAAAGVGDDIEAHAGGGRDVRIFEAIAPLGLWPTCFGCEAFWSSREPLRRAASWMPIACSLY
jgi:hypothetical protein